MTKRILELEVSSLFPIDLTEAAFTGYTRNIKEIEVHLNSELANSAPAKTNKFVSRGSLPLTVVEATNPFGWQCIHTNDTNDQGSELEQFLHSALIAAGNNRQIQSRAAILRECELKSKQRWWDLTANILNVILEDMGFQTVNVTDSGAYRMRGLLSGTQKNRLYRLLCSAPEGQEQKFLDGGFVEFLDADSKDWIKSSSFRRTGTSIFLQPQHEGRSSLEIRSSDFDSKLRCRGLLQHVLAGFQEGNLVDLPWFACSPNFQPDLADGHEHVSPFSIRSKTRIENRLYPTAYSIVDYDSELAANFASTVLGFDVKSPCFVADYERLSRYPPITRARLAKDQSSIRPWTRIFEREIRRALLQTMNRRPLLDVARCPSFSSFGFRQVLFAVALELAKPSSSKPQDVINTGTVLIEGIVGSHDFSSSSIIKQAETQLAMLRAHFRSTITLNDLRILTDNLEIMKKIAFDQSRDIKISSRFFSKSRAFFIDIGSIYYAWLAACVTGPLKAHLLILWLLHGGKGLHDCFDDIVQRRNGRAIPPSLPFSINYFEQSNGGTE